MTDQLKLLLTESCKGTNLYFQYKGLKDTNWTSNSLKIAKSQEEFHGIDPCEMYEIRLATDGPELTPTYQELSSIGPYYETLNEFDLNKVEFDEKKQGENYYTTTFIYDVSHHNESFVTLNFGKVCAKKMKIWSKHDKDWKMEHEITSNKKVKLEALQKNIYIFLYRILSRKEALLLKLNSAPITRFYSNFA